MIFYMRHMFERSSSSRLCHYCTIGGADVAALVAAQQAVGAFPLPAGSKDAVLYLTLAPGAYTAQVTGVGAGTGVDLVEIYQIP
jgi:hypothetical protein